MREFTAVVNLILANLFVFPFFLISIFSPGAAFIFLFRQDLFHKLDKLRLVSLSAMATMPVFLANLTTLYLFGIFSKLETKIFLLQFLLTGAGALSIAVFSIAIALIFLLGYWVEKFLDVDLTHYLRVNALAVILVQAGVSVLIWFFKKGIIAVTAKLG